MPEFYPVICKWKFAGVIWKTLLYDKRSLLLQQYIGPSTSCMNIGMRPGATITIQWLSGKGKEKYRDAASDTELLKQQRVATYILSPCYVRKANYLFKELLIVILVITG